MIDIRIDEVCDERSSGGDFFVYLKPGYSFTNPPQHCFGAVNACIRVWRNVSMWSEVTWSYTWTTIEAHHVC